MTDLRTVYISAEMSPYAKTGGLADVAGSLPKALRKQGIEVISIMPRYKKIEGDLEYVTDFAVQMYNKTETCIVRKDGRSEVPVFFIDNYSLFDRTGIYGHYDDGLRYAFFCKAALIFLKKIDFKPDVINLNDWHTAPIAMILKEVLKNDDFYKDIKTVLSIHNLKYQGLFGKDILRIFDVAEHVFTPDKTEYYGRFNFLKAGISYCDHISTVSKTYAREILTPQFGEGLDGHLMERKHKLTGIVNGIDTEDFDPSNKQDMFYPYSVDDIQNKSRNKNKIHKILGITIKKGPAFGIVSRLDDQKGLHLVLDAMNGMLNERKDITFLLLGTGDPFYEHGFNELKREFPENVSVNIEFDLELAKHIYAGADIFLMPSKFEPCGLGQLISLRYGTIPIVRSTGGLKDTVRELNNETGNGFTFEELTTQAFKAAIDKSIDHYYDHDMWIKAVKRAMSEDNSWNKAAAEYIYLYKKVKEING